MSTEYYICPNKQCQISDVWGRLKALVSGQPFCIDVQDNLLILKGTSSQSEWTFDIRIFFTEEILIEISSWNDSVGVEFGRVLTQLSEEFSFIITDEDFDTVDLI
ncbi:hypothetical protein ACJ5NV_19765 [Loktanella agnita]|uniref:hypothetical protein n=1 Tax=Loktanella agnita TaxID=287097 RepID=UPI003989E8FE